MVTLAQGFAERGLVVDVVLVRAGGPFLEELPPDVRVVDLKSSRTLVALPKLAYYLATKRPRAVLATLRHANIAAWLARCISRTSMPIVFRETNARSLGALARFCYARVEGVVALSAAAREKLVSQGVPTDKVKLIYNPANTPDIDIKAREEVVHSYFYGARKIILAVGRLVREKDYPTLIRSIKILRKKSNVKLLILGEGGRRGDLENMIVEEGLEEFVSMPGFVENPFAYMRAADLFVLSSASEGLPNALIQAMACGTPVVSTDCPTGPNEILQDGKWGRLVPVGDAEALASAMAAALDDPSPPDVRTRAADFSVDKAVDAYLDALGLKPAPSR